MVRLEGPLIVIIASGIGIAFAISANLSVVSPPPVSSTFIQTTSHSTTANGTLSAGISVGPTQPVCYAHATVGPAPTSFNSIDVVITDSSGHMTAYPVNWVSNGCYVTGSMTTSLAPGSYSLSLSSCNWMGCKAALPKDFVIYQGRNSDVNASISTGIA